MSDIKEVSREELLLVKEILALPVRENSSALQMMDGWEIAAFILQYQVKVSDLANKSLADSVESHKSATPASPTLIDEVLDNVMYYVLNRPQGDSIPEWEKIHAEAKAAIAAQIDAARIDELELMSAKFKHDEDEILRIAKMKKFPEGSYLHSEKFGERLKELRHE
jgi:hypothetical protein